MTLHVNVKHISNKAMRWTTSSKPLLSKNINNTLDCYSNELCYVFNINLINSRMIWSLGETGYLWRGFRWLYPSTVINIADGNLFESCIYSMDMHVHVLKRECICWFVSLKIKTVKLKLGFFIVCWFLKKHFLINCLI